jgi:tRNA nucleotidyltransferase (CCA-adding enzyme)
MISKQLKKELLKEIKPTQKEHDSILTSVEEFISKLEKASCELNISSSFLIGGSFGKGTYLKTTFDVDIFCRFDLSYKDSELSNLAKKILEHANITYVKQKGSRDYFSGDYNLIHFELVPNYFISELKEAKNSTDYSPRHVEFVKKEAEKNPNLLDEIRLTKQFLKAKNLYGAESYINGFSGHIIDLLIIYYGSLDLFLESAKQWNEQTLIDVAKHYASKENILGKLDDSKVSNLIVVDSILKDRNAARALGKQKYFELIKLVSFTNQFTKEDFKIKKESSQEFIKRKKSFSKSNNSQLLTYTIHLNSIDSEDIAGSKLLKLFSKVEHYYTNYKFTVFEKEFYISFEEGICIYSYSFQKEELSNNKLLLGPQLYRHDAVKKFSEGKNDLFVVEERICSYQKRELTLLKQCANLELADLKKLFSKDLSFIEKVVVELK